MGCASLNFWDSLCLHAALLGNPSMEPCGDHEGTPSCLRVPLPHVSLPKTLHRIRFLQEGNGEEGAGCRAACSPHHWSFCPSWYPVLPQGSPWHMASVLPELGCAPAVPQFPFMPAGRPCALHSNTADRRLVL